MISNPARFFVNGSDEREFTYEGGTKLFHWSPYESGLSKSMESNVIFFANDVDHARNVLSRLFKFWLECNEEYVRSKDTKNDYHGLAASRQTESETLCYFIENLEKMTISEAPTNQFYKVGWACNDDLSVYKLEKVSKRDDEEMLTL